MTTNKFRTLSVSSVIACLMIAASPAWARYEPHYGYAPRYAPSYRPAVVVPQVLAYGYSYPPPPGYYVPPPAYVPAPAYYGYYGRQPWHMHRWPGRRTVNIRTITWRGTRS